MQTQLVLGIILMAIPYMAVWVFAAVHDIDKKELDALLLLVLVHLGLSFTVGASLLIDLI